MIHTIFSPEFGKNRSKGWARTKKTKSQILVMVIVFLLKNKKKKHEKNQKTNIHAVKYKHAWYTFLFFNLSHISGGL